MTVYVGVSYVAHPTGIHREAGSSIKNIYNRALAVGHKKDGRSELLLGVVMVRVSRCRTWFLVVVLLSLIHI